MKQENSYLLLLQVMNNDYINKCLKIIPFKLMSVTLVSNNNICITPMSVYMIYLFIVFKYVIFRKIK